MIKMDFDSVPIRKTCQDNIMMDDWKLKTSPVVRLERPNERFVDSRLWE